LIQASSSVGFGLLIVAFADPVDFQIQARTLRIDRTKDFEEAQYFVVLAAAFQVTDLLFDCSYRRNIVAVSINAKGYMNSNSP
jgi:hypothetical protein